MRNELTIETLQRVKAGAVRNYYRPEMDSDFWELVAQDCDEEIIEISKQNKKPLYSEERIVAIIIVALILAAVALAGCRTVQGIGEDITWMGKAGQEALENSGSYMEK